MSSGITMEVPEFDDTWIDWYGLLNASVWEEVLCRLCMIGIPMAILGLLMKEKKSWKCLFGRFEMSGAAVVFIIISSLVFGLAHLQGWDVYKIIPTFVTGLAFGYLFVKYGIYASIMLHFLVDYSSSFIWVLGDITGEALSVLFIFGMAVLGIVFLVRYTIHGFNFMKRTVSEIKKPPETVP
jgi:membrane protease YdiL (CAAX protease family)